MRYQGQLTNWNDDRGFGFITQKPGGKRLFVHISAFHQQQRRPCKNDTVTYELTTDAKGRPQAARVAFAEALPLLSDSSFRRSGKSPWVGIAVFLAFVWLAAGSGHLPLLVPAIYLVASAAAFIAYALDKSAARKDRWRTRESTLHLLALVGGWPGAYVAQRVLRHKSRKAVFQVVFWLTVVVNCTALVFLFTQSGAEVLRSVLTHVGG